MFAYDILSAKVWYSTISDHVTAGWIAEVRMISLDITSQHRIIFLKRTTQCRIISLHCSHINPRISTTYSFIYGTFDNRGDSEYHFKHYTYIKKKSHLMSRCFSNIREPDWYHCNTKMLELYHIIMVLHGVRLYLFYQGQYLVHVNSKGCG